PSLAPQGWNLGRGPPPPPWALPPIGPMPYIETGGAKHAISSKCVQLAVVASISKALKSNSSNPHKPQRARVITSSNRRYLSNLDSKYTGSVIVTNHRVSGRKA